MPGAEQDRAPAAQGRTPFGASSPVRRGLRLDAEVERRLLLTWRADPEVVARLLPAPFRPQLVGGAAVVGVCCIRLGSVRPRGLPAAVGLRAENAAHRVAVAWDGPDGERTGVWVARRHTGSRLVALAGGRLFPGRQGRARFDVDESDERVRVAVSADDGTRLAADVEVVPELSGSTLFADLAEASDFFRTGSTGWSAAGVAGDGRAHEGMRLDTDAWHVDACRVLEVRSSLYDDPVLFPPGTVVLDDALLMRRVPVTWTALRPLPAGAASSAGPRPPVRRTAAPTSPAGP
ncbi:DUF2071 domain-containing protein [Pseudokineococcus basanitobsidens]|uniref:DUF2071 domain-containing protein n=1 Tax=Pseudokineococcus basanitobsidens TaxID=1926649 RepID=A0ABU8RKA5_9ACTN